MNTRQYKKLISVLEETIKLLKKQEPVTIKKPITYIISDQFNTYAKGVDHLRNNDKVPFTMKENIIARLKDKKLFDSYLDSCTAAIYKANSDEFLIVPKCDLLINIDKYFNESSIILSDEEYAKLKKKKGTIVLNRKEIKCDELLTLEEAKNHKVWLALCENDKKLLSEYAEYYFKEFKKDRAMRFWVQNKSNKNELRSVVLYYVSWYDSSAGGNIHLSKDSRFVSSSPTFPIELLKNQKVVS